MNKIKKCSKTSEDLLIDFHLDIAFREQKIPNIKRIKGNYQVRSYLKEVFHFAGHINMLHTDRDVNQHHKEVVIVMY